jgi:hypothetical protein
LNTESVTAIEEVLVLLVELERNGSRDVISGTKPW